MQYYFRLQHWKVYVLNLFNHLNLKKNLKNFILSNKSVDSFVFVSRLKFIPKFPIPLSLLLMSLLPYSFSLQALMVSTSKVIHGSAPYFTFEGGRIKATTTDTLLAIELPDGSTIRPSTNLSSPTNPITLINGSAFNDIHMAVPQGTNSISLNDLITRGNWGDDDGDGVDKVTATGSLSVYFADKDGNAVNRSDTLDICKAPYKIILSSTEGSLTTQYGVPNRSAFDDSTVLYYIKPNSSGSCYFVRYVRPNLRYGSITDGWGMDFAGPPNIWDSKEGFLVQATNSSDYGLNFPTTGLDGLYFDLGIEGGDASQLTWHVETKGDIKATISWRRPIQLSDSDIWIPERYQEDYYVTRVTLNGPSASPSQLDSDSPSRLKVPSLPQTFELVGTDSLGNEVKYGFVLKQWFVSRGLDYYHMFGFVKQSTWCDSLGYKMSRISDLTNAKCGISWPMMPFPCDADGAKPSSAGNFYQRRIGAGFFTEWGVVGDYGEKPSALQYLWTSDFYAVTAEGMVMDFMGMGKDFIAGLIADGQDMFQFPVICATPYE